MTIRCIVLRERFQSIDRRRRPYAMELVHYVDAATGQRLKTKGFIVPANAVTVLPEAANDAKLPSTDMQPARSLIQGAADAARCLYHHFF
jgi:hypothetical protein